MSDNLQQALEDQKQQTKQEVQSLPGMLGIPLGGQKRVEVPERNSYVYVRLRSNQSEVIQAFNNKVAPAYNLPVLVERQGNRYVVTNVDTQRYENNWSSFAPFLPRHGNTHSFNTESGGGGDIVWVYPRQFTPSLVMPSGSTGAGDVIVMPYTLMNPDGTWRYTGNTGTDSFLPYRPSMSSGAVMGLVYLDVVDGNPKFVINSGTIFSNSITGSSQIAPYIPQVLDPSSHVPLAAIRLITGTSVISWDNIYDIRQEFRPVAKRFSNNIYFLTSGSAGVAGYDLMTLAFPTGTYNFYSSSISATGTLIGDWITEPTVPNTNFISAGVYHLHVHASKTAGTKDANIKFFLFKRTAGGTETQILSSELSNNIPASEIEIDLESVASEQSLSSTDRLGIRIYGYQAGVGSAPTVQLKVEGDTLSRFEIPAISSSGGSGGGIPEAPTDGKYYGRRNSSWADLAGAFLRLDASNVPLTGALEINYTGTGTSVPEYLRIYRNGSGAGQPFNKAAILVQDNFDTARASHLTGGLLKFYDSLNELLVHLNPYASGTADAYIFDTTNYVSPLGTLLSVRNQGNVKFTVNGTGTPNIPAGLTYNVGGSPHIHGSSATNGDDIFRCNNCATSAFAGTIATLPGGATLTYTLVSGAKNVLTPVATTQLAKLRLYNTTRGTSALILDHVGGTNTITLTANVPAGWTAGDTITIASQTVSGGGVSWVDLEIISGEFLGASIVYIYIGMSDTGGAGQFLVTHPFETFGAGKIVTRTATQSTQRIDGGGFIKITSNIFSIGWSASGAATATPIIRESLVLQ